MQTQAAVTLANTLLAEFGITLPVKLTQAKRTLGAIMFYGQLPMMLKLSAPFVRVNDRPMVENVIRHEIAHVLAGREAGHGPQWRIACQTTGATPTRTCDDAIAPPAPYALVCKMGCKSPKYRKVTRHYMCTAHRMLMTLERTGR